MPTYFTGDECDVSPYLSEYKPMKGISIASACTAYNNEETGETIIIDVNQGLYFGDRMEESLVNPNQVRSYGLYLNDNPFEPGELFGIHNYKSEISIPFVVHNGTVSFKIKTPMELANLAIFKKNMKKVNKINYLGKRILNKTIKELDRYI